MQKKVKNTQTVLNVAYLPQLFNSFSIDSILKCVEI